MGKKILIVSQYFYPENFRINDIAEEWIKRGYSVTVLTGIPNYPEGNFFKGYSWIKRRKEFYKGINIIRIPIISRGKTKFKLSLNYLSFVISGYLWKLTTRHKFDLVFIYEVSPMTQALPGVWLGKRLKIPVVLYVTDLWPENVEIVSGFKNKYVFRMIGKMVDYIYAKTDLILTSSESFIDAIKSRGVIKSKLKYWPQYAEDFYKPFKGSHELEHLIPNDGRLNIIFTGNMGVAQGLDILVDVAKRLVSQNLFVRFNMVGDGRFKNQLIKLIHQAEIEELFNFIERQAPEDIPKLLSMCDFGLIVLNKSPLFAKTIPAKTQSYLASRIPVLASADGEIYKLINDNNLGFASPAGDVESLVNNIKKILSLSSENIQELSYQAIKYNESHFSKSKLLDQMDDWFDSLITRRK
jgi:glycosyltransferase involved in cell wall biosynthesis